MVLNKYESHLLSDFESALQRCNNGDEKEKKESRMNTLKKIAVVVALAVVVAAVVPNIKADESDWSTMVTINQPIRVGGSVLAPGTYLFKLVPIASARNIVSIYSADKHLLAIVSGLSTYRVNITDDSTFTFAERAEGAPQELHSWFYPDMNYGIEFRYPGTKPVKSAKASDSPITMAWVVK